MKFGTRTQDYLVTRPRLKNYLEDKGFTATETTNPFSDYLKAWAFPLCRDLAVAVWEWYTERQLPVPYPITEYLKTVEW